MPDFKRKVEQGIGSFKYDTDTWGDVFARIEKDGGIDFKSITNVLICILEELDDRQEKERTYARPESSGVSKGTSSPEKEI